MKRDFSGDIPFKQVNYYTSDEEKIPKIKGISPPYLLITNAATTRISPPIARAF